MCLSTLAHLLRDYVDMPPALIPLEAPSTIDQAEFLHMDPALYFAESEPLRHHALTEDGAAATAAAAAAAAASGDNSVQRVHIYSRVHLHCWILYRLLHASHWHAQQMSLSTVTTGVPARVIDWEHDVRARTFIGDHDLVIKVFLDWVSQTAVVDTAWIPLEWQAIAQAARARIARLPPPPPSPSPSPHPSSAATQSTRKATRCCLS